MRLQKLTEVLIIAVFIMTIAGGCSNSGVNKISDKPPNETILAFYYPWYGNPETDGEYRHWNHEVLGDNANNQSFPGGDDIGANFYPYTGCYSSNDKQIIEKHMEQMREAGIGLVSVSWWGKDSFEDKTIPKILDAAKKYDIRVTFHIEPFEGRNAETTVDAIKYIYDNYGTHAAFYRAGEYGNLPMFFIYDSYRIESEEWTAIFGPESPGSIRGTEYDALVIALWVEPDETDFILNGGFDGFYTYFATDKFTYGSTTDNWPSLSEWAKENDKLFIPCVGPGYLDTRIRPWNKDNTRSRAHGAYYDRLFASAIQSMPDYIGITSFNEWHEGTQIEPAVPKAIDGYVYNDYSPMPMNYYLTRTRYWVDEYEQYNAMDSTGRAKSATVNQISKISNPDDHMGRNRPVTLAGQYSSKYDAGGMSGLVDGLRGSDNYRDGRWQGYEQVNFEAVVDLEEITSVSSVTAGFLHSEDAWVFLPKSVELSLSEDGSNFASIDTKSFPDIEPGVGAFAREMVFAFDPTAARFVRVRATNIGTCPDWHPGAGGKAWLFVDEIIVR